MWWSHIVHEIAGILYRLAAGRSLQGPIGRERTSILERRNGEVEIPRWSRNCVIWNNRAEASREGTPGRELRLTRARAEYLGTLDFNPPRLDVIFWGSSLEVVHAPSDCDP